MDCTRRSYIRNAIASVSRRQTPQKATTTKKSLHATVKRSFKRSHKRLVRFSVLATNVALLGIVGWFVLSNSASSENAVGSHAHSAVSGSQQESDPLDKLSSTDVAVHVARLVQLDESTAVTNKADTASTELVVTASADKVIAKPQIVSTSLKSNKDIKKYVTVSGDTVSSVAAKFGVTSETIRLSNGISGELLPVGKELMISPVNGIIYRVQAGDTVDSLSARYRANRAQLIAMNDAEVSGLVPGTLIVIPDGVQPTASNSSRYASSSSYATGFAFGSQAMYGGNGYDYGWCTWHAANRRIQIGRPIPTNLGNAISWLSAAQRAGLATGSVPRDGAVLYHTNIGGLGHVAFVEKVNADGTVLVSDMNYPIWGRVTYRTLSPGEASSYRYIY